MTLAPATDGFAVRQANFPDEIELYAPGLKRWQTSEWKPTNPRRFLPVSVTGSACALQCDHCQSKVLEGMISVRAGSDLFELARELKAKGSEGLLVSGGSGRNGAVPHLPHLVHVPRIRDELGMKVIVHSGVVTPQLAEGLAAAGVDGVMLDIIGADETIHDVYHLDLTVADFMAAARSALPTTKVNLGCARPLGTMKHELDEAAVDHGLNGIAYPADGIIAYARSRGLEPKLYEYCCSLTWAGDGGAALTEVSVEAAS